MEPVGVSWCRVRQLLKEWWKLRGLKARGGSPVAMEVGGSGVPGGPAASPPSLGGVSERVWEGRRGWKPGRGGQQAICMRDRLGMSWSGRLSAHTERGRRRTRRRRRGGRRELPPPPPPGRGGEVRAKFGAAGPGC